MGPIARVFAPDRQLILPALFMVALTTLLCGAAPALRSTRVDLLAGLRKGTTGAADRLRLRNIYVAGQVALSLVLLTVASLCWRSQARIADIDLGFDIEHGVVTRFSTEPTRQSAEARQAFVDQVVERITSLPGVQSAAVTGLVPLGGDALVASFHPAGRTRHSGNASLDAQRRPRLLQDTLDPRAPGAGVRCHSSGGHTGGSGRQSDLREHLLSEPVSARPTDRYRRRSVCRDHRRRARQQDRHAGRGTEVGGLLPVCAASETFDRHRPHIRRSCRDRPDGPGRR